MTDLKHRNLIRRIFDRWGADDLPRSEMTRRIAGRIKEADLKPILEAMCAEGELDLIWSVPGERVSRCYRRLIVIPGETAKRGPRAEGSKADLLAAFAKLTDVIERLTERLPDAR